jgi:hypothetical protein
MVSVRLGRKLKPKLGTRACLIRKTDTYKEMLAGGKIRGYW